ncbi:flagellin [Blastopirellula retiformator]|uniref:Flagellar filament 30.7 kDa core protein n=1 Tax=Blastopirellula retiformator TaxID=2527970 RepID=A0A5C5VKM8_9BACT|nr:flagellin [Blastopirellula retiformator]TWT38480.1 Flagellar filament 30.7 kDa core protein [Blastopirellula retiformator]
MNPVSTLSSAYLTVGNSVNQNFNSMLNSIARLSTGQRINRAADDPAGLLAAEAVKSQITTREALLRSSRQTSALIDVADGALSEASRLTNTIRGNLITAASSTTSDAERAALQLEIDGAIDAFNRLGDVTYNGRPVFSGEKLNVNYSPDLNTSSELYLPTLDAETYGGEDGVLADLRTGGQYDLESGDLASALKALDGVQSQLIYNRAEYAAFDKYSQDSIYQSLEDQQIELQSIYSELMDANFVSETAELTRSAILAQSSLTAYKSLVAVAKTQESMLDALFDLNRR